MQNKSHILKHTTIFILPYILLYTIYVQINGESSPGGGFQAGAIFAAAVIAIHLGIHEQIFYKFLTPCALITSATLGILIYCVTGLIAIMCGGNFLDYNYIYLSDVRFAQSIGIFFVELGVGITVSSVLCLVYALYQ